MFGLVAENEKNQKFFYPWGIKNTIPRDLQHSHVQPTELHSLAK